MFKRNFLKIILFRNFNYRFCSVQKVRVRFAPSPTGELHLGSLRTALFNYLYAKKYGGSFILRIEDTDMDRLVPGVDQKIEDTLEYFGLKLDEGPKIGGEFGPYRQSERLITYRNAAQELIESGHAYKCFCSPERLNILRKKCTSEKTTPRYDKFCRNLTKAEIESREKKGQKCVIRFKFDPGQWEFKDTVYGDKYKCQLEEGDFIIMKRDGFPTYHFANVVDDHNMKITDVIRGSEWLSSTPKHLEIYTSFNWNPPRFTHLPLLTQDGQRKLSKRNAAAFADYYTSLGYLPDAVMNYLLRNGNGIVNHDKNKLYTLQGLVQNFDENLIGRRSFMMDITELDHYGKLAFRKASFADLLPVIKHQFSLLEKDENSINQELLREDYFKKVITFLKSNEEAFAKLSDLTNGNFRFFFMMPKSSEKLMKNFPNVELTIYLLKELINLTKADKFKSYNDLKLLEKNIQISGPELSKLFRLSLIDCAKGPPVAELVKFFGKEGIEQRLNWMISKLENAIMTKQSVKI